MGVSSMTGFGSAAFTAGGVGFVATVRSVNRKSLEVSVRVPPELAALEPVIRSRVAEATHRGEVQVMLDRDRCAGPRRAEVDEGAARALFEAFGRVAKAVGSDDDVPLWVVLQSPEVVRLAPATPSEGSEAEVLAGVELALGGLLQMRAREGEALARDLRGRLAAVRSAASKISAEAPAATRALMEKALARARGIVEGAGANLDPQTLANAAMAMADRMDIAEELSRLEAHFDAFETALAADGPHGRRLDFLCQEMMREASTASAKAASASVSHLAVEMKSELERLREQLANVL